MLLFQFSYSPTLPAVINSRWAFCVVISQEQGMTIKGVKPAVGDVADALLPLIPEPGLSRTLALNCSSMKLRTGDARPLSLPMDSDAWVWIQSLLLCSCDSNVHLLKAVFSYVTITYKLFAIIIFFISHLYSSQMCYEVDIFFIW